MNSALPEVSAIIPTYNNARELPAAVRSVLNQTYQDYELIIVDDGSTDNTVEVVKTFLDSRIRYVRIPLNQGLAQARNVGIANVRGHYVAFLDADDEWLPEILEVEVKLMDKLDEDVGLVCTCGWLSGKEGKFFGGEMNIDDDEPPVCRSFVDFRVFGGLANTWLFRLEALKKTGHFDRRIRIYEDSEFLIRFTQHYKIRQIRKPYVLYNHFREGALSSQEDKKLPYTLLILAKHRKLFQKNLSELVRFFDYCITRHVVRIRRERGIKALASVLRKAEISIDQACWIIWLYLRSSFFPKIPGLILRSPKTVCRILWRWMR